MERTENNSREILLHTCCAPCASASIERLMEESYRPVLFFANSNIFPYEEFLKREEYVRLLGRRYDITCISHPWEHDSWLESVKKWASEPERGKRCEACFSYNLSLTAQRSHELGIPLFTTTLTISPHKSSDSIFYAGKKHPGFLDINFKKKNGYARSIELSREYGIYRQDYCGCEFSQKGEYPQKPVIT